MPVLYLRLPEDRIGAAIGPGGSTKRALESATRTEIAVDPDDGEFRITAPDDGGALSALKARDVLMAIGRGFSPERARRLLKEETYLAVIDIKLVSGKKGRDQMWRIRSRLIGVQGRARARLEELSGCSVSVYGSTVALIGGERELERAVEAVELLLHGSEHSTVFHWLARKRREDGREDALAPSVDEPIAE